MADGAAGPGPSPRGLPPAEATRLSALGRDELYTEYCVLVSKFADWKARAKSGVDVLRTQLAAASEATKKEQAARELAETRAAELDRELASMREALEQARQELASHAASPERVNPNAPESPAVASSPIPTESASPQRDFAAEAQSELELAVALSEARAHCVASALASKCVVIRSATVEALSLAAAAALSAEAAAREVAAARVEEANVEHASARRALEAQCDTAVADLAKLRAEFDKYKSHSSRTLKLTATSTDDLQRKTAAAVEAHQDALKAIAELENAVGNKDRVIHAVEERYEAAMSRLAVVENKFEALQEQYHDLERDVQKRALTSSAGGGGGMRGVHLYAGGLGGSHSWVEHHGEEDDGGESREHGVVAQEIAAAVERATERAEEGMREELEAMAAAHREEIQSRDVEIVQMRVRLAQALAKSNAVATGSFGAAEDPYVATIRAQLSEARSNGEALKLERDQLQAQVRRLLAQGGARSRMGDVGAAGGGSDGPSPLQFSTDANQALASLTPDEVKRQLIAKSEQLWEANQQVLQLRTLLKSQAAQKSAAARSGSLTSSGTALGVVNPNASDEEKAQQSRYTRAVLINFFAAKNDDVRAGLVPVLATLLQLSTDELRAIYKSNPDWIT
jgi:hypothetical protein